MIGWAPPDNIVLAAYLNINYGVSGLTLNPRHGAFTGILLEARRAAIVTEL